MALIAPYGSWASSISAEIAAAAAISFSAVELDGADLYWLENRPAEAGRATLMRSNSAGEASEVTPASYSIRSTVHEYGGGAFTVAGGTLYFVNLHDQRIYLQERGRKPVPLTPDNAWRHADLHLDPARRRVLCVREDHSAGREAENSIVSVQLDGSGERVLVAGNDFYSNPRLSADGTQLAYLTWNHPNMPWDGCELHVAPVDAQGSVGSGQRVAGGPAEAVFQPEWMADAGLLFASDPTGWWNLYIWRAGLTRGLRPMAAEFGRAMWSFGISTYGIPDEKRILCCYTQQGLDKLALLELASGSLTPIETPYTNVDFLRCRADGAAFVGSAPSLPPTLVTLDFRTNELRQVRRAFEPEIDAASVSPAASIQWLSGDGQQAHGLYYAPANAEFTAPAQDRPPLLVVSHSGPTSAAVPTLRYGVQYWTSRGFAVLEVNYRGSTGYGRRYRERLNGEWGVVDVDDCCSGALFLANQGLVDRARMAIKGSSSGGFTALACLAFRSEVFAAGIARYGVADLELLAEGQHKFESRSAIRLIGPYPARRELWQARSPLLHAENIRCGLLLLHGDDDRVVPATHSELIYEAVRSKGQPAAIVKFSGEGHGFRGALALRRAQEAEHYFLTAVFGLPRPVGVPPIPIANLSAVD